MVVLAYLRVLNTPVALHEWGVLLFAAVALGGYLSGIVGAVLPPVGQLIVLVCTALHVYYALEHPDSDGRMAARLTASGTHHSDGDVRACAGSYVRRVFQHLSEIRGTDERSATAGRVADTAESLRAVVFKAAVQSADSPGVSLRRLDDDDWHESEAERMRDRIAAALSREQRCALATFAAPLRLEVGPDERLGPFEQALEDWRLLAAHETATRCRYAALVARWEARRPVWVCAALAPQLVAWRARRDAALHREVAAHLASCVLAYHPHYASIASSSR